jgi:hypothetical protein
LSGYLFCFRTSRRRAPPAATRRLSPAMTHTAMRRRPARRSACGCPLASSCNGPCLPARHSLRCWRRTHEDCPQPPCSWRGRAPQRVRLSCTQRLQHSPHPFRPSLHPKPSAHKGLPQPLYSSCPTRVGTPEKPRVRQRQLPLRGRFLRRGASRFLIRGGRGLGDEDED